MASFIKINEAARVYKVYNTGCEFVLGDAKGEIPKIFDIFFINYAIIMKCTQYVNNRV